MLLGKKLKKNKKILKKTKKNCLVNVNYMTFKLFLASRSKDDYAPSFLYFFFSDFLHFGLSSGQFGVDCFLTRCRLVSIQHSFTERLFRMTWI